MRAAIRLRPPRRSPDARRKMGAELVESIGHLRQRLTEARRSNATIGLVPTMGALHAGHVRLIEEARHQCQAVAVSIFTFWVMLNHSNLNISLGFLDAVVITPKFHRIHHQPATSNRNFGTVFTFWDRLRGTFIAEVADNDPVFGVPEEVDTYPQGWFSQFVEPLRKIL